MTSSPQQKIMTKISNVLSKAMTEILYTGQLLIYEVINQTWPQESWSCPKYATTNGCTLGEEIPRNSYPILPNISTATEPLRQLEAKDVERH